MRPVLLDTGVIVALLDRSERHHDQCAEAVQSAESPLVTCEAVIAEACYVLRNLSGASESVVANVASGVFQVPFQLARAAEGVRRLLQKYSDLRIDFADACLIHTAGELRTGEILTLDRDFEVYRWGANKSFRLLIPLG